MYTIINSGFPIDLRRRPYNALALPCELWWRPTDDTSDSKHSDALNNSSEKVSKPGFLLVDGGFFADSIQSEIIYVIQHTSIKYIRGYSNGSPPSTIRTVMMFPVNRGIDCATCYYHLMSSLIFFLHYLDCFVVDRDERWLRWVWTGSQRLTPWSTCA